MFAHKENHKNNDVVFMEDSTSIRNDFEMRLSGKIEGPTLVIVDESSKLPKREEGEKNEEHMGDSKCCN